MTARRTIALADAVQPRAQPAGRAGGGTERAPARAGSPSSGSGLDRDCPRCGAVAGEPCDLLPGEVRIAGTHPQRGGRAAAPRRNRRAANPFGDQLQLFEPPATSAHCGPLSSAVGASPSETSSPLLFAGVAAGARLRAKLDQSTIAVGGSRPSNSRTVPRTCNNPAKGRQKTSYVLSEVGQTSDKVPGS
jgi:hypothetical protein